MLSIPLPLRFSVCEVLEVVHGSRSFSLIQLKASSSPLSPTRQPLRSQATPSSSTTPSFYVCPSMKNFRIFQKVPLLRVSHGIFFFFSSMFYSFPLLFYLSQDRPRRVTRLTTRRQRRPLMSFPGVSSEDQNHHLHTSFSQRSQGHCGSRGFCLCSSRCLSIDFSMSDPRKPISFREKSISCFPFSPSFPSSDEEAGLSRRLPPSRVLSYRPLEISFATPQIGFYNHKRIRPLT